jgi:hypothetical protein
MLPACIERLSVRTNRPCGIPNVATGVIALDYNPRLRTDRKGNVLITVLLLDTGRNGFVNLLLGDGRGSQRKEARNPE